MLRNKTYVSDKHDVLVGHGESMRVAWSAGESRFPQETCRVRCNVERENIHDASCVDQVVVGLTSPAVMNRVSAATSSSELGINGRMSKQPLWFECLRVTDLHSVPVSVD